MTSHLQRIQNYAARVILRLPKTSNIATHLKSLHWLPVKVGSTYKICFFKACLCFCARISGITNAKLFPNYITHKIACLCYHCQSSTAPSYVTGMLQKKPSHTRNTCSSSYTMPLLNRQQHSKATLGDHSFLLGSSSVWNSIQNDVRCDPSLSSSKSCLKTNLFYSVYKD